MCNHIKFIGFFIIVLLSWEIILYQNISIILKTIIMKTKGDKKIEKVKHEFKEGNLKSGKDGKGGIVTNQKQAVAIALSEARKSGAKIPAKKKTEK